MQPAHSSAASDNLTDPEAWEVTGGGVCSTFTPWHGSPGSMGHTLIWARPSLKTALKPLSTN